MTCFVANICNDATTRTVKVGGVDTLVTDFNVARNYQGGDGQRHTKFYRISIWRDRGAKLAKWLKKGRPVFLTGEVDARAYIDANGEAKPQLQMTNPQVQFITSGSEKPATEVVDVPDDAELPFPETNE